MAVFYQRDEVDFECTGHTVTVPNNDVARLMYYLNCVCVAVECEQDSDIRRFTNYNNWSYLSFDEQKVLLGLCGTFSPDVLDDKVFFYNETLCGDSLNEFLEIRQVRHQLLAAESIVIAGQTREVNKIMVYTRQWMDKFYWYPLRDLLQRIRALETPAISYTPPPPPPYRPTYQPTSTTPILYQPTRENSRPCCCQKACVLGSICTIIIVLGVLVGFVIYYLVHEGIL